jgi:hypothetical protein
VARLRELEERFVVVAIEPEIGTKDLLIPVGSVGDDDDRIAIGREFNGAEADAVKEVIEGEFWFALSEE